MSQKERIKVFKIGGNVTDNPIALKKFVEDFATVPGRKILVHGGGKEATRLSERLNIETKMIEGRRVTDRATIDIVTMVYAGLVNKRLVALLQANGVDAIGLTGADGNAIKATRRSPDPIDFGFVGDIDKKNVNTRFIGKLLDEETVPTVCAIMHDGQGTLLNCNADSVASAIAGAFAAAGVETELIYCFEKDGVLRDIDAEDSLIEEINPGIYKSLKEEGVINKGMIPKIENAFKAIEEGVVSVTIKNSANVSNERGTKIRG